MRLTPLDIQNHTFSRKFSGYDTDEVSAYLHMIADDLVALLTEREHDREQLHTLEKRVRELEQGEKILRETLVSAQAMSEELRQTAIREAEVLIGEAEIRAEKILDASHRRAARLSEDVRELRLVRRRVAAAIRSTLQNHLEMIDSLDRDYDEEESALGPARAREPEPVAPTEPRFVEPVAPTAATEAEAGVAPSSPGRAAPPDAPPDRKPASQPGPPGPPRPTSPPAKTETRADPRSTPRPAPVKVEAKVAARPAPRPEGASSAAPAAPRRAEHRPDGKPHTSATERPAPTAPAPQRPNPAARSAAPTPDDASRPSPPAGAEPAARRPADAANPSGGPTRGNAGNGA